MLEITIPSIELWDEQKQEFLQSEGRSLQLEHSLVSISKWESKWCKVFLSKQAKTREETLDYIRCMTLNEDVDPSIYLYITDDIIDKITDYINAPMTATTFSDNKNTKTSREVVTAEVIYYWLIALQIPFECQYWHLNRLITLVQVCNIKNAPSKKMSNREVMSRNAALNSIRRKKYNTRG